MTIATHVESTPQLKTMQPNAVMLGEILCRTKTYSATLMYMHCTEAMQMHSV